MANQIEVGGYRVTITDQELSYSSEGLGEPGDFQDIIAARLVPFSSNKVALVFVADFDTLYDGSDVSRFLGVVPYTINRGTGELTRTGDVQYTDPSAHGTSLSDVDQTNLGARSLGGQAIVIFHGANVLIDFSGSTPVVQDMAAWQETPPFAEQVAIVDHSTGAYVFYADSPEGGGTGRDIKCANVRVEGGALSETVFNHGIADPIGGEQASVALHSSGLFAFALWETTTTSPVYPVLHVAAGVRGEAGITLTSFTIDGIRDNIRPSFTATSKDNHAGWFEDGSNLVMELGAYAYEYSGDAFRALLHVGITVSSDGSAALRSSEAAERDDGSSFHPPSIFRPSDTSLGTAPLAMWGRSGASPLTAAAVKSAQAWSPVAVGGAGSDDNLTSPALCWSADGAYAPMVMRESSGWLRVGMVEPAVTVPRAGSRSRGQRAVFSR